MLTFVISSGQGLGIGGGTTSAIDTTGSKLIVLSVSKWTTGAISVSDSKGNTWVPLTERGSGSTPTNRLYYCENPIVGSGHTFTVTGSSVYIALGILAFNGSDISPFDLENGNTSPSGNSLNPGSITPSIDNEVVITSIATDSSSGMGIDSGFTFIDIPYSAGNNMGGGISYKIQTIAAAINPAFSWAGAPGGASTIASFKSSSGPSLGFISQPQFLG